MSRTTKLAALAATSAAVVAMTAAPAAAAWTNGTFTATSGSLTIKVGLITATCSGSVLKGTINTAGAYSVTSATVSGCPVPVTTANLPWSGSFNSTTGAVTLNGFQVGAAGCVFAGNLSGTYTGATPPATAVFSNQTVSPVGSCIWGSAKVTTTYVFTQP